MFYFLKSVPLNLKIHSTRNFFFLPRFLSLQSQKQLRNVGIVAHIDAGKTTTTERMLYYAGKTSSIGEVHEGKATMDFLAQEKERGITINAACTNFEWRNCQINLIDTPGHIDFTVEVERSMLALDSVVLVLDAIKGVESQTRKVFQQTRRFNIPSIVFINKMDRVGANFKNAIASLESNFKKFNVHTLTMQLPLYRKDLSHLEVGNIPTRFLFESDPDSFIGVIDLVELRVFLFDQEKTSRDYFSVDIFEAVKYDDTGSSFVWKLGGARLSLFENVALLDDEFGDIFFSVESHFEADIGSFKKAVQRILLENRSKETPLVLPVFCGAAYKNIAVQQLLDAIVLYFPEPACAKYKDSLKDDFLGLVFKIQHDSQGRELAFTKIEAGKFQLNSAQGKVGVITNISESNHPVKEKVSGVFKAHANEFQNIADEEVCAGDILIFAGTKEIKTGDVLTLKHDTKNKWKNEFISSLRKAHLPEPVFSAAILVTSQEQHDKLIESLNMLVHDDPSLRYLVDEELDQVIVSGMGELHLEVTVRKLQDDFKVKCKIGDIKVAYRETLLEKIEEVQRINTNIFSKKFDKEDDIPEGDIIVLGFSITPNDLEMEVKIEFGEGDRFPAEERLALKKGVEKAISQGPLLGAPLSNLTISLVPEQCQYSPGTKTSMLELATTQFFKRIFRKYHPKQQQDSTKKMFKLLEPYGVLTVEVADQYLGAVISNLSGMRGSEIRNVESDELGTKKIITAGVALSSLVKYSTTLRTITKGEGVFQIEFEKYSDAVGDSILH